MNLHVINSNSQGNAYILQNEDEALLIECGVNFKEIKKGLNFNISKVVGCLVTHEHKDHCKAVGKVLSAGIDVYATRGTHEAMATLYHHRSKIVGVHTTRQIGRFKVYFFDVEHDCADPVGFYIDHPDTGKFIFLTDTFYCKHKFAALNNVIIEANHCKEIIRRKLEEGKTKKFLRDRVIESHMSLQTCVSTLLANDLSQVNNILLIHLSDSHSDADKFKTTVRSATGKPVHIADPGLIINFNKNPF